MFTVKWVVRGKEAEPIKSEGFKVQGADTVVAACRYRLAAMRLGYPDRPPDGFIVLDASGKEVARWFDVRPPGR
jgi:hypothetical protein